MFDSLSEQIKQDEAGQVKTGEVVLRWLVVIVVSLMVFGGLYFAVRTLG